MRRFAAGLGISATFGSWFFVSGVDFKVVLGVTVSSASILTGFDKGEGVLDRFDVSAGRAMLVFLLLLLLLLVLVPVGWDVVEVSGPLSDLTYGAS